MTIAAFDNNPRSEGLIPTPRCLILVNPRAGAMATRETLQGLRGRAGRSPDSTAAAQTATLTWLAEMAAEVRLDANVELVPPPDRLPALIRSAQSEGFNTIVAVGGDGTVRTIAQHLIHKPLRLGILPLGTANNVARGLGIPSHVEDAMRVLAAGLEKQIDVGKVQNEYFLEGAGVGLFADALNATGEEELYRWQIRRLLGIIGPLCWNPRARRLQITLDGETQIEEAVMVVVANGCYMGESMAVAPDACLNDGLFDVVILGALSRWELFRYGAAIFRKRHLTLPKVHYARARVVEIRRVHRVRHPLPVHADDHIVSYLPARMEVVPDALRVIVPPIPEG